MFNNLLIKAIHKSQHVQRNWDLSKSIPEEDLTVIENAVTGAPSKQNVTFFKPYFITDRHTIEKIHRATTGFYIADGKSGGQAPGKGRLTTNPQTLANLLIVFADAFKPEEAKAHTDQSLNAELMEKDKHQALGIAAGYVNIVSSLLGYSTGCCSCCDKNTIQKILGIDEKPMLLMGVGIPDASKARREHHLQSELTFPTHRKDIQVTYLD
jgi:nitroreductase